MTMPTTTTSAGLVNLQAPLPSPPAFDLLAAATIADPANARWLGGAWIGGDAPGPAYTHNPCSTGTDRVKPAAGLIPDSFAGAFTVLLAGFCTVQSIGPDPEFFTDRLELAFGVYEGAAVERVLATGDVHGNDLGSHLGDTNMEVLGGGAVPSLRAMELLETAIRKHGSGIIHCAPATATAWVADTLIAPVRGVMRTQLGTPVAVGPGYIGVAPDGQGAPASDQEWAFASGPIEIYRDDQIAPMPANYSEAIDRSMNDAYFLAERAYLLNWLGRQDPSDDDHVQAGVLIDLVP